MAVPIVAKRFVDGMKYLRIRALGYTFYSQNTLLALLIEASGCKKCSHILSELKLAFEYHTLSILFSFHRCYTIVKYPSTILEIFSIRRNNYG